MFGFHSISEFPISAVEDQPSLIIIDPKPIFWTFDERSGTWLILSGGSDWSFSERKSSWSLPSKTNTWTFADSSASKWTITT